MRHIGLYKTIEDYYNGTSEIPDDWSYISYVRTNFKTGDETIYGIKGKQNANVMWIDDYPDGVGIPEGHGYNTMEEYLENLVESRGDDGKYDGANKYCFNGETIEYAGETYYLWEMQGREEYDYPYARDVAYALTSTIDYDTLYNLSIEKNTNNRNCPIYAFLNEDMNVYIVTDYSNGNYALLKVEDQ